MEQNKYYFTAKGQRVSVDFNIEKINTKIDVRMMTSYCGKTLLASYDCITQPLLINKKIGKKFVYTFIVRYLRRILSATIDPERSTDRKYIYVRARQIYKIGFSLARKVFMEHVSVSKEDFYTLGRYVYRAFPGKISTMNSARNNYICRILEGCKNNPKLFKLILSDMKVYSPAVVRYIIQEFMNIVVHNMDGIAIDKLSEIPLSLYNIILKKMPKAVKKCKYLIKILPDEYYDKIGWPKNRYGWFMAATLHEYLNVDFNHSHFVGSHNAWKYFRKHMHISKPYSKCELTHMLDSICDGRRLYFTSNKFGIKFMPVKGSPLRMVKNAIYNHRQEQKIRRKELLSKPDKHMVKPPMVLPEWVEDIRIKTYHGMLLAGLECKHCLGSFTNSPDIFVRKDDVCAQIDRKGFKVCQCYDVHDQITKKSKHLRSIIDRSLIPLRKDTKRV